MEIHLVPTSLLQRTMADVADDADHPGAAVLRDLLPDRIAVRPQAARQVSLMIDHLLARRGVPCVEEASRAEWNLHRLQIVLIDHSGECSRPGPGG